MHCVHNDTLYVKNRRNKSEKKKKKLDATIKKPTRFRGFFNIYKASFIAP
jgi:hypothetical protein